MNLLVPVPEDCAVIQAKVTEATTRFERSAQEYAQLHRRTSYISWTDFSAAIDRLVRHWGPGGKFYTPSSQSIFSRWWGKL